MPSLQDMSYSRIKSLVNEELKSYFRPEFLNRLDEIIVFRQLTKKEVKQIADIMLRDVFKRGEEKGLKIEVTEKFKDRCAGSWARSLAGSLAGSLAQALDCNCNGAAVPAFASWHPWG
jgi:ATP-dependent Clp protease ATP-binding subunit ClpA